MAGIASLAKSITSSILSTGADLPPANISQIPISLPGVTRNNLPPLAQCLGNTSTRAPQLKLSTVDTHGLSLDDYLSKHPLRDTSTAPEAQKNYITPTTLQQSLELPPTQPQAHTSSITNPISHGSWGDTVSTATSIPKSIAMTCIPPYEHREPVETCGSRTGNVGAHFPALNIAGQRPLTFAPRIPLPNMTCANMSPTTNGPPWNFDGMRVVMQEEFDKLFVKLDQSLGERLESRINDEFLKRDIQYANTAKVVDVHTVAITELKKNQDVITGPKGAKHLRNQIDELLNDKYDEVFLLDGLPFDQNKDLPQCVIDTLSTKLNIEINRYDIRKCKRFRPQTKNHAQSLFRHGMKM